MLSSDIGWCWHVCPKTVSNTWTVCSESMKMLPMSLYIIKQSLIFLTTPIFTFGASIYIFHDWKEEMIPDFYIWSEFNYIIIWWKEWNLWFRTWYLIHDPVFQNADLSNANLEGAILEGANLKVNWSFVCQTFKKKNLIWRIIRDNCTHTSRWCKLNVTTVI